MGLKTLKCCCDPVLDWYDWWPIQSTFTLEAPISTLVANGDPMPASDIDFDAATRPLIRHATRFKSTDQGRQAADANRYLSESLIDLAVSTASSLTHEYHGGTHAVLALVDVYPSYDGGAWTFWTIDTATTTSFMLRVSPTGSASLVRIDVGTHGGLLLSDSSVPYKYNIHSKEIGFIDQEYVGFTCQGTYSISGEYSDAYGAGAAVGTIAATFQDGPKNEAYPAISFPEPSGLVENYLTDDAKGLPALLNSQCYNGSYVMFQRSGTVNAFQVSATIKVSGSGTSVGHVLTGAEPSIQRWSRVKTIIGVEGNTAPTAGGDAFFVNSRNPTTVPAGYTWSNIYTRAGSPGYSYWEGDLDAEFPELISFESSTTGSGSGVFPEPLVGMSRVSKFNPVMASGLGTTNTGAFAVGTSVATADVGYEFYPAGTSWGVCFSTGEADAHSQARSDQFNELNDSEIENHYYGIPAESVAVAYSPTEAPKCLGTHASSVAYVSVVSATIGTATFNTSTSRVVEAEVSLTRGEAATTRVMTSVSELDKIDCVSTGPDPYRIQFYRTNRTSWATVYGKFASRYNSSDVYEEDAPAWEFKSSHGNASLVGGTASLSGGLEAFAKQLVDVAGESYKVYGADYDVSDPDRPEVTSFGSVGLTLTGKWVHCMPIYFPDSDQTWTDVRVMSGLSPQAVYRLAGEWTVLSWTDNWAYLKYIPPPNTTDPLTYKMINATSYQLTDTYVDRSTVGGVELGRCQISKDATEGEIPDTI